MKIFLDTIRSLIIRSEFLIFLMNSLIKIKNGHIYKKEIEKRQMQFLQYAAKNLLASAISEKIIKMNCTEEAQHAKDPSCSAVCNDRQQRRIENRI